jgi:hypothetical protein
MGIIGALLGNRDKEREEYVCWMCRTGYVSPAAFLWHIKACDLEQKARACVRMHTATTPVLVPLQQERQ